MADERETHRRSLKLKEWGRNFEQTVPGIGDAPKHLMRTDADGYICTGNAGGGEPVVILGDSFTECVRVPERLRFCSVVERILRAQGKAVCIKNAGMSGANMMHHIFTLLAKIIPLQPKLVILVIGSIDVGVSKYKEAYWSLSKFPSIFTDTTVMDDELYSLDLGRSKYRLVVQSFIKICKTFQIKCCFVSHPYKNLGDYRDIINKIALHLAEKHNIPCIDFREKLNCLGAMFYDPIHLNTYGSALFGKFLAKELLERELL